jgi:hypothetical protein
MQEGGWKLKNRMRHNTLLYSYEPNEDTMKIQTEKWQCAIKLMWNTLKQTEVTVNANVRKYEYLGNISTSIA